MTRPKVISIHPKYSTERAARVCPSALKSRRNISLRDGGMEGFMDSGTFNSVPHCEFVSAWQNTPFKAAFPLARALIAVSYGKHAAKGSHVVMAKKHLKLEMCQEMKHYEALLAPVGITKARGIAPPQTAKAYRRTPKASSCFLRCCCSRVRNVSHPQPTWENAPAAPRLESVDHCVVQRNVNHALCQ